MTILRSKLEPTAYENHMCANVRRVCLKIPHLLYHAKANSTTVKSGNKQIYALQDLPASLDIGICRPFGTACSSPPFPERAFSRKFERHHEIQNSPFHVILEFASWLGYFSISESLWNPEKCFCFFKKQFPFLTFPQITSCSVFQYMWTSIFRFRWLLCVSPIDI